MEKLVIVFILFCAFAVFAIFALVFGILLIRALGNPTHRRTRGTGSSYNPGPGFVAFHGSDPHFHSMHSASDDMHRTAAECASDHGASSSSSESSSSDSSSSDCGSSSSGSSDSGSSDSGSSSSSSSD